MTDCLITELLNTKNEYNRILEEMEKKEEESLPLYDIGNYNKVNIIKNEMNEEQKNYAIDITQKSLNMYKDDHSECVKYITEQFDNKYGEDWCVFLRPREYGSCCLYWYDNCYINFEIGEFNITIFKSNLGDESLRLYDKGNYNKVNIITNYMNEEQKNYVIDITQKSLSMHKDNPGECVTYIREQLVNKYGGKWCVFLRARNYGNIFAEFYDNCLINFSIGEFDITIFKSHK